MDSWKALQLPDEWHLVIAGPDLLGWQRELEARVERYGMADAVSFVGELDGERKASALCGAELFVLPTHSENFGIVIGEALASGTPVITTKEAPWKLIEEEACGWWIEDSADHLFTALREATDLTTDELSAKGAAGQAIVVDRYQWEYVADQMLDVYRWMLNGGECPDVVWSEG